jgi:hypothetical protein
MMDVREQLQQPIIRPVISPAPAIIPPPAEDGLLPQIVEAVPAACAWPAPSAGADRIREDFRPLP